MLAKRNTTTKPRVGRFPFLPGSNFARLVPALATLVCFANSETGTLFPARPLAAQQIGISTPFTTASDSFYERFGVDFGFSLPGGRGPGSRIVGIMPNGQMTPNGNLVFRQGGIVSATPQFGGYDPAANARFGFNYLNRGGGGFSLGLDFGQGSSRSMTTTTPSVVVQNGHGGSITSGAYRPFVTGIIPISGNGFQRPRPFFLDNAVTRAIQSGADLSSPPQASEQTHREATRTYSNPASSAQTSDVSVAEIKAQQLKREQDRKSEFNALLNLITIAESKQDYRVARINLRKAIKLCESPAQKEKLKSHLAEIRDK